ncbi:hypothetical protein HPB50_002133 [Hyalomma asiaticum]|uniref:Uncharacterized protein n=1 Tax=Hyalomma asiaticum TaxID=266040 RepID=A0ACB7RPA5_HYAAI|nr:hypothetical protein HPB50_002133 [Hyalomma asiaticum]
MERIGRRSHRKSTQSNSTPAPQGEDYIVEKVLDRREWQGKLQYLLKWKGYPASENTWEPEENLHCPDLIGQFLKKQKQKAKSERRQPGASKMKDDEDEPSGTKKEQDQGVVAKPRGFDRGLEPDRIIGATESSDDPKIKQNTQADVEPQPVDTENGVSDMQPDPQIPAPFQPESTQADRHAISYTPMLTDLSEKCFILKFNINGESHYELDVWPELPNDETGIPKCLEKFNQLVGKGKFVYEFYKTNCDS